MIHRDSTLLNAHYSLYAFITDCEACDCDSAMSLDLNEDHGDDMSAVQKLNGELTQLLDELRTNQLQVQMLHIDLATSIDPKAHVSSIAINDTCSVCKESVKDRNSAF